VRFIVLDGYTYALKEEPAGVAGSEFEVLRRLEGRGLPAVTAVALAESVDGESAILATRYLSYSIQYRRLLMRFPLGPGPYRDRLLDAMATLLADLHRAGVFWGDCSLANTLFRRDGDKIQAYLVDAETSEIHPSLSDGQRAFDLDILVENVGFGLADLGAMQGRPDAFDDAVEAAETVRTRYNALWDELHLEPELSPTDRHAVRARIRRLNDLGFAVEEISLEPTSNGDTVRMRVAVANRRFYSRELQRLTGLTALEGQARLLLNDLLEYQAWLEHVRATSIPMETAAELWLRDVLQPSLATVAPAIGPARDPLQAYCDVLEQKWLLSEATGRDVGLETALDAYLALGAPAPEQPGTGSTIALDIDWSTGFEPDEA
jgi:tRNA A-37 threonylcarbamoyl transferase component Bud32